MRLSAHFIKTTASVAAIVGCLGLFAAPTIANAAGTPNITASDIAAGKKLAFNRKKGNCLACHQVDDGSFPGNIGPPLVSMKARFPNFADLRAQIYDARVKNPNTIMIPFGPNKVLTDHEIDLITKYIYTL
jgi:sulfur-oxidizing protein SoxX